MPDSDNNLLLKAAKGDLQAIYTLVYVNFYDYLRRVVKKHFPQSDESRVEEIFSDFYYYLGEPNTRGEYRLRNISENGNPKTYLARTMDNWLNDLHRKPGLVFVDPRDDDDSRKQGNEPVHRPAGANEPDDTDGIAEKELKEKQITAFIETFQFIDSLPPRERYILLTYLIGEQFKDKGKGHPLKLNLILAEQLGMNPSTIYNKNLDNKDMVMNVARERLKKLFK